MTLDDLRDRGITRRCALLGAGGVGAAAVLAACSSGSDSGSSADAAGTSAAPTTASTPDSSAASTPASSAASPAGGSAVIAALADVPVGGTATAEVDGETVLLSQPTAGTVDAFSSVCPHQGGQVKPAGAQFECSLHHSQFALDGAVTRGPSVKDLTSISVAVSGTDIVKA